MKKLKQILDYIFYMSYTKEKREGISTPLIKGIIDVSFIFDIYIFIIFLLLYNFFHFPLPSNKVDFPYVIFVLTIPLVVNYMIYGYKNRYKKILDKYDALSFAEKKKYKFLARTFIIFSIILLIIVAIIALSH